jgi:hypothetical protein
MPTEKAPSRKRAAATAGRPWSRGKTPTAAAYPARHTTSVRFADQRRIAAPIGSDSPMMPNAKYDASDPISGFVNPRASRWWAMTEMEMP